MPSRIVEFSIGVLADDEMIESVRQALVDLLTDEGLDKVPWTLTLSKAAELSDTYQHLLEQARIERDLQIPNETT